MRVARLARAVTTTSEVLAEKYRSSGVERVSVIPNQLNPAVDRSRHNHKGVVIGWIAAAEHQADIRRLGIADALQRVLNKHPQARVECIGVDLKLRSERYRHDRFVAFQDLPQRIGGFDIGIAPLADIPFNRARSDIKLKEYAASGVPWLASPVGPYRGLGEQQGGWLVPQDGWYEALDRLVSGRAKRWWLGRRARRWARTQTIEAVADRWEQVFVEAAGERA
jgi:glycosyltransferase involved in cell wall biosynthesis